MILLGIVLAAVFKSFHIHFSLLDTFFFPFIVCCVTRYSLFSPFIFQLLLLVPLIVGFPGYVRINPRLFLILPCPCHDVFKTHRLLEKQFQFSTEGTHCLCDGVCDGIP